MRPSRRLARYWAPLLLWMGLIFWLSSRPASDLPKVSVPGADKVVHFVEFGGLGVLLQRALLFGGPGMSVGSAAAVAIAGAAAYGVSDELHQSLAPEKQRHASVGDVVADVLGATAFVAGYSMYVRRRRPASGEAP